MAKRSWFTPEEDAVLRARYCTEGARALASSLGRSEAGVIARAQRLGLARPRRSRSFPGPVLALGGADTESGRRALDRLAAHDPLARQALGARRHAVLEAAWRAARAPDPKARP